MLILTRRVDESIYISEDIRIMVVEIDGKRVKLGIDAPRQMNIQRSERRSKTKACSLRGPGRRAS